MFCFELPGGLGKRELEKGVFLSPSAQCGFFLVSGLLSRQGHKRWRLGLGGWPWSEPC